MDWSAIKEGIRTAIGLALALPDVATYKPVAWEDSNTSGTWNAPAQPRVRLRMHEPDTLGQDGVYHSYDEDEDKLLPVVSGPRQFFVTVRIASESNVPGGSIEPVSSVAGKLRSRMLWPRITSVLTVAGLGIQTIRPTINASEPDPRNDGRALRVALVDIVFNAAENDTDTADAGDYFTTVELAGKAGTDLADIPPKIIGVDNPPPGTDP